ncbi:MAG: hypothetical protein CBC42_01265 [Betaproteobacteria bacterium TMED82]|nr:MAG: hypothetical protein CBC42_01265 [Betaproteobacteria bacterium TMED82]|tara:strand:- start:2422 stop:2859 length:438 start_codon:yes stop_codon:yes gene_type:complete
MTKEIYKFKGMKKITVVCGLIFDSKGLILITRRSGGTHPGEWEFPGGKLEDGESEKDCLHREIHEELSISIANETRYFELMHNLPEFTAHLIFYTCDYLAGEIFLQVHDLYRWVEIKDLLNYDFLKSDVDIIKKLTVDFKKNDIN